MVAAAAGDKRNEVHCSHTNHMLWMIV